MTPFDENCALPGYEAGPGQSGVKHSHRKLEAASKNLQPHLPSSDAVIQSWPCKSESLSWAYRCKCAFQILKRNGGETSDPGGAHFDHDNHYYYAMRHKGNPIDLGTTRFPIATQRIQVAMHALMNGVLNHSRSDKADDIDFGIIRRGLTSVTFSSAWQDLPISDCIITLHYGTPIEDEIAWKRNAFFICKTLKLRCLHGRSKKRLFSVRGSLSEDFPSEKQQQQNTIRDTVLVSREDPKSQENHGARWRVYLPQEESISTATDKDPPVVTETEQFLRVFYEKPETAFFHPNAYAMKEALQWMLERLSGIIADTPTHSEYVTDGAVETVSRSSHRLLEMYCGCGAHTIALGKTGLLEEILAIELDPCLVDACQYNIRLNQLEDMVKVVRGDAGTWAKRSYKWSAKNFNILLVDPPRAGLDEEVRQMAKNGIFQHFLYISCGHKALLRDLKALSSHFDVIHCRQLDLFPRTDSIETLVHLRRKIIVTT